MDSPNSFLWLIGAGLVGLMLGNTMGSSARVEDVTTKQLAELTEQVQALSSAPGALAAVETESGRVASGLSALETETGRVASGLSALESAIGRLGGEVSEARSEMAAMSDRLTEAETRLAALDSSLDAATAAMARAPAAVAVAPAPEADTAPETETETETVTEAEAPEADRASELAALIGDEGLVLGAGETGTVGEQRMFLSRLSADAAHVFLVGRGQATVGSTDSPTDLGNGCTASLAGIVDRRAYFAVECESASADVGTLTETPGTPETAETAETPETSGTAETTETAAADPEAELTLAVGETGLLRGQRVFLSRLSADAAHVLLVGRGPAAVGSSTGPTDIGNGCTARLVGIADRRASFAVECVSPYAGVGIAAESAADDPVAELTLAVGETGIVRGQRVFLSRLGEDAARIMLVGRGMIELAGGGEIDLGNGCALRHGGASDGRATLQPSCD